MLDTHIAIIGAGPGGLTLGRLLQLRNIPFVIYEKDSSPTARQEGGSLDLQPDSGQRAMKAAGLWDQFNEVARYQGQDFKLMDKHGKIHISHVSTEAERDRPEVDRKVLRKLLLESVGSEAVRWDWKLNHVSGPREDGRYGLQFMGREEVVVADMVVGADGARSVVRELVSDVVPVYSSCTMVELRFCDVEIRHPDVSQLVGRGSLGSYSYDRALMGQRNGDGSIRIYVLLRTPESWVDDCGIDFSVPQNTREGLLKHFEDWNEGLKALISKCDDQGIIGRPLYALPIGHSWITKQTSR